MKQTNAEYVEQWLTDPEWNSPCKDSSELEIFERGDLVADRDGFKGRITKVTNWEGSVWYDVRFKTGEAVRYTSDLTLLREE